MAGVNIYGELYTAQVENWTSDPATVLVLARVGFNSTSHQNKFYNGSNWRAFLANDEYAVIGNSGTPAQNVRLHRGASGLLQFLTADDTTTADGTLATAKIAQFSFIVESYATGALPASAAGTEGRLLYDSTTRIPKYDNGSAIKTIVVLDATQTLTNKTLTSPTMTTPAADYFTLTQQATPAAPAAGKNQFYFKSDDNAYYQTSGASEIQLLTSSSAEPPGNFIINSNFDIWQAPVSSDGISYVAPATGATAAISTQAYGPDGWYCNNTMDGNAVITIARVAGTSTGALYGCSVKTTTSSTATTGTCELYQTLDNFASLPLLGQVASFSIRVKAIGNANQIGLTFMYKTSEGKVDSAMGAEATTTISTAGFVACSLTGITLTAATIGTAGVVGIRIRLTGVSSGTIHSNNNGFIVEQAILNIGSTAATYRPMYKDTAQEFAACERFLEKSYNLADIPTTATDAGEWSFESAATQTDIYSINFSVRKRANPTVKFFSPVTGTVGKIRSAGGADVTVTTLNPGEKGASYSASETDTQQYTFHFLADARI